MLYPEDFDFPRHLLKAVDEVPGCTKNDVSCKAVRKVPRKHAPSPCAAGAITVDAITSTSVPSGCRHLHVPTTRVRRHPSCARTSATRTKATLHPSSASRVAACSPPKGT
ncbi:uncharacterized protein LOC135375386 isoform X3 [Ornithodoros turicata]|uniref:uncharacterized protein LOC135375386 isoform X3 n=1 Tax=Ornithodoros turicata TaxID=34597 RepID=UPI00313943AD